MKQNNRVRKRKKRDGKEKKKEGFSRAHEFLQSKETVPAKYVATRCGCWILAITQAECTFANSTCRLRLEKTEKLQNEVRHP